MIHTNPFLNCCEVVAENIKVPFKKKRVLFLKRGSRELWFSHFGFKSFWLHSLLLTQYVFFVPFFHCTISFPNQQVLPNLTRNKILQYNSIYLLSFLYVISLCPLFLQKLSSFPSLNKFSQNVVKIYIIAAICY